MEKAIKYIAHYDVADDNDQRNFFLPACTKLDYIFGCLERMGHSFSVLSACGTRGKAAVHNKIKKIGVNGSLELLAHHGRGNKIKNVCSELLFGAHFKKRLFSFVEEGDVVVVYHSLSLIKPLTQLKKRKNFKLILEIEEIYGDVLENSKTIQKEMNFFDRADAFIFSTELLNRKINKAHKPFAVSYGTYDRAPIYDKDSLFSGDKIHCVYAGTLDPRKGGGITAVKAAEFLSENYHMHILGFGSSKEVAEIKALIETVSQKSAGTVSYDGLLNGEDYLRFLQNCQIGLSTQNPLAAFNDTSFPSKILSYMSNGLRVVSVRIPVIEHSKVGPYISFYQEQDPQKIADAIMSVDFSMDYDSRKILETLDQEFCKALADLIGENIGK